MSSFSGKPGVESRQDQDKMLLGNSSVLMIDDEPILIELVRAFLEDAGYQDFDGISEPLTALDRIRTQHPDVILLDLMMPGISGFEILEQVRKDDDLRHIPVIVMTSASDAQTKLRVLELGATDFLEKPVDPSELALRLRNTLAFKAQRDRMTYFDTLTNLPNRRLFISQLQSALRRNEKSNSICALLHVDIDRFKKINETLGHKVGDGMLKVVAQRLQSCLLGADPLGATGDQNTGWSLSRIGGDEFIALMPGLSKTDEAVLVARRMIQVLSKPILVDQQELFTSASIGIAAAPLDARETETLMQHANAALSVAKDRGKNTYAFYSADLNEQNMARMTLENDLRKAVARDEFVLYFQPKVDVKSNRIVGAEGLIRWKHPSLGMIPPGQFISLAEDMGLIIDMSRWVLAQACGQAVRWRKAGINDCGVSVNISPAHFHRGQLLRDVQRALELTGLNPYMLTLEITESLLLHDTEENLGLLEQIKSLGVRTGLDDFGTGFSSLAYLKRMRINELKIDQSFIQSLPDDTDSSAIVRAILAMSRSLGLEVTAEGVEREDQLQFLIEHDCDLYQGFLCSQAIPADAFFSLLRREYMPTGLEVSEEPLDTLMADNLLSR